MKTTALTLRLRPLGHRVISLLYRASLKYKISSMRIPVYWDLRGENHGSYFSHGPEFLISKKGRRKEEGERRKRKRKENEEKEREGYRTKRHTCLIIKYNIVGTYCCSSVYELFVIGWWCCEAKNKQVGQSLLCMVTRKLNNDDVFLCIDVFCIIAVWSVSQSISLFQLRRYVRENSLDLQWLLWLFVDARKSI